MTQTLAFFKNSLSYIAQAISKTRKELGELIPMWFAIVFSIAYAIHSARWIIEEQVENISNNVTFPDLFLLFFNEIDCFTATLTTLVLLIGILKRKESTSFLTIVVLTFCVIFFINELFY